jgi:hypothetical protein
MFWMRAYPLRGQVGRCWALKIDSFLGPVKWHEPKGECHLGPKKCTRPKHYAQACINHRCIGGFMCNSP